MEIAAVNLYTVSEGTTGESGAENEESQYWGGGWAVEERIANPMSIYEEYRDRRTAWMGPGQDPFVVELETDTGETGFCANYGAGATPVTSSTPTSGDSSRGPTPSTSSGSGNRCTARRCPTASGESR